MDRIKRKRDNLAIVVEDFNTFILSINRKLIQK